MHRQNSYNLKLLKEGSFFIVNIVLCCLAAFLTCIQALGGCNLVATHSIQETMVQGIMVCLYYYCCLFRYCMNILTLHIYIPCVLNAKSSAIKFYCSPLRINTSMYVQPNESMSVQYFFRFWTDYPTSIQVMVETPMGLLVMGNHLENTVRTYWSYFKSSIS